MKVSHQEVYGNLATLLNAGIDLKKALHTSVVEGNGAIHDAVISVMNAIERGTTLAKAVARYPEVFPVSDRALIDAGEKSGRLPEVFQALTDWYKLKSQLWRIIKSGLTRPIILIHAGAFIMPIPILVVNAMWGKYILSVLSFLMIFYVPTGVMIGFYRWSGTQGRFRLLLDRALLKIPVLGIALRNIALGRYCFGFWMLFVSGIPMQRCAEIAASLCGNTVISAMLDGGKESARQGKPISEGFSSEVPHDFLALWVVGEESGRLDDTVWKLYEKRIEQGEFLFKEFSRWLPRLIYALVSLAFIYYILSQASTFTARI